MLGVSLLSGGKDSFLSTLLGMEQGIDVIRCVTVIPETDSMMFHVPNIHIAGNVASLLDLETEFVPETDYEEKLLELARSGVEAIVCGAIASEFQKTRIEKICTEAGMVCFAPLWMKDQRTVIEEIISSGIRAIIVSVSAEGLGEELLGRVIDENLLAHLVRVHEKNRINITGEGGEYESLVTGIDFRERIKIREYQKIWNGSTGYLKIESVEMR